MITIVHVITGLNVGGAETMLYRLLSKPRYSEHKHVVISLTGEGFFGSKLKAEGIEVHCLELRSLLSLPSVLLKLNNLLALEKPQIVQSWLYHADFISSLVYLIRRDFKLVWGVRSTNPPIGNKFTFLLVRILALFSQYIPTSILCVAHAASESHIKIGYCKDKLHVIQNGLSLDNFRIKEQWHFDHKKKKIVCVGRFHPDKGQDILLKAFARARTFDMTLELTLIGHGCVDSNNSLSSILVSEGIEDCVRLAGSKENIAELLADFDFFCMPSRTEGFPNCLLEAFAAALPCISTSVGDVRSFAEGIAVLVEPENVEQLSRAIVEMATMDHEARQRIGQLSRRLVEKQFSITSVKESYQSFYTNLLEHN